MATESPVRMLSSGGMRGGIGGPLSDGLRSAGGSGHGTSPTRDGVAQELGLLFKGRSRFETVFSGSRDVPQRSGSAPPSVEGSLAAMGGLFGHHPSSPKSSNRAAKAALSAEVMELESEQELRSDPAYLAYYYSHINLNPRLPPPLISRENWRLAQRLQSGLPVGGIGDKRKMMRSVDDSNSKSLFSTQPVLPTHREELEPLEEENSSLEQLVRQGSMGSVEWMERGGDAFSGMGMGARPKSLVDLIQEDFPRTPSPVYNHSRSSSRAANEDGAEGLSLLDGQLSHMREPPLTAAELQAAATLGSRSTTPIPPGIQLLAGSNASAPSSGQGHAIVSPTESRSASPAPMMGTSIGLGSRQASLNAVAAAGAVELAAALQGLGLSDVQAVVDDREQLHQHQLQQQELRDQELREQQQHLRLQQQQQRQQRQIAQAQAQAQVAHSQTQLGYNQTLQQQQHQLQQQHLQQQQQLYSGVDPAAIRAQAKFGVPSQQAPGASLQPALQAGAAAPMYAAAAAAMSYMAAGNPYFQGMPYAPQYNLSGYPMNPTLLAPMMAGYPGPGALPVGYDGAAAAAAVAAASMGVRGAVPGSPGQAAVDMQQLYKFAGAGLPPITDPLYNIHQYMRAAEEARAAAALSDPALRGYMGGNHVDMLELQKGQLNNMLGYSQEPKSQYPRSGAIGLPITSKSGSVSPAYYGSPPNVVMPFGNSSMASPAGPGSPVGPASLSIRRDERNLRIPAGASRTSSAGAPSYTNWQNPTRSEAGEEIHGSNLLEEFKNSKTRRFELSDISGHVVEFSADQHGSRFIQQKLETASSEEKSMVFQEVLPRALNLMTDVFGNYVIQKFFEHGTPQQRRDLANQLVGHVLALSLQMYGCRVIQKALEVVDVDQQTELVSELDGNVMRCVRDQNGNHVIQKCIECVPPDRIHFIISAFYGNVLLLSTHPYGCRVIQRVLEHCTDDQKQRGIMEEILRATCNLAQDQYGNYVVQHVLEHGRAHEKSDIITKLAGQIVHMSQHKFASNVVEKCLEFGGPAERQILINEMLGRTDENEPLQAMMKDQFANYVVQKVLETCDDQQREMLLSRIRVHLHALKKYTYGKHIVARVEKLVAAGERRSASAAYNMHLAAASS